MNRYVSRIASATASGRERLRHHQAVIHPEVGVHRGDRRREQPGAVAGHRATEQADTSTTAAPKTVMVRRMGEEVVAARVELLGHPRGRRERERGERRVLGGLRTVARIGEAVAVGERVGLGDVVDLVAQRGLVPLGEEHVADAERERGEHDQQQDAPEAPVVGHRSVHAERDDDAEHDERRREQHGDRYTPRVRCWPIATAATRPPPARAPAAA